MHTYNLHGWYAADAFPTRPAPAPANLSTSEAPGELRANWTGYEWLDTPYAVPPPATAPAPEPQRITRLAFRNRFTTAEKVALEIAGLDDPTALMPARAQAASLRANQADLAAATFVDLQRGDTRAGVLMLEAAGLLAAGRALLILDSPITTDERPLE